MSRKGQFTPESRKKIPPRGPGKFKTVKESVLSTFNKIQEDEDLNLEWFAKNHPKDFYNIAAKLIPTEVQAKIDNKINLHIVRGKPNAQPLASGAGESTGE